MIYINPVDLEVISNNLQCIAEEMGTVLKRTALSLNIKERRDFSTAILTTDGELVAQGDHIPLHLALIPFTVKAVLNKIPLQKMEQGDVIITNDPYTGGPPLPDICLLKPVYSSGNPIALIASYAHHVDVGGTAPGSTPTGSSEIFQEGIRIPPAKITTKGKTNRELLNILSHNTRLPGEFSGNIQAQLNAAYTGEKELQKLARRYGIKKLCIYMKEIINHGERSMRSAISSLPEGEYSFEDYLENDGLDSSMLKLSVNIKIGGEKITVDFSETCRQAGGPVNTTRELTCSSTLYAIHTIVAPELPANHGINRTIEIITPEGTLVNPYFPAPVASANTSTAQLIVDIINTALAPAVPEKVTAPGTGSMNTLAIGGLTAGGKYYTCTETHGGGQGGMYEKDGMDSVHVNMTNNRNIPVEIIESYYPLRVEKYSIREDSSGAGKYRGGCGLEKHIRILEKEATVTVNMEHSVLPPRGLKGGVSGAPAYCSIKKTGENTPHVYRPARFTTRVPGNSIIILKTAGGGGFGPPGERDPEKIQTDIKEGFISPEKAEEDYGSNTF